MKKNLIKIVTIASLLTLVACGETGASTEIYDKDGNEMTELRVGLVVDDADPEAGRANDEFREAMESAIGIPIVEVENVSHLIGIEAMRSGNLDVMLSSPFTYMTAQSIIDVDFLATINNPDQKASQTVFITSPENTHILSLADFEGESFAFVDTSSMTGFLFPMYQLVSTLNLDHTQMLNPGYFFSTTILSGGHDASLMAAINGDVSGAAVGYQTIENMIGSGIISEDDFRIVYTMEPGPDPGYIVRSNLPQLVIDDLRTFLLAYDNEDYFYNIHGSKNARFIETDLSSFDFLKSLMERLDLQQ